MAFVVDASVAANWFLPDEEPEALEAWRMLRTNPALVPQHWWFEVRNSLLVAERRDRIRRGSRERYWTSYRGFES
jgi:predicted nucleic acid-binding protein